MNKLFKQIVVAVMVATMALMSVGCYGSFNLTKKVYNWNGSLGNKWVVELVFLASAALPVYGIAAFVDLYILNLVEFWTGKNPMASNLTSTDGTNVAFNSEKNQVEISYAGKTFVIVHENGKSMAKDAEGNILAIAEQNEDGSMNILDANGNVTNSFSSNEVVSMIAGK